MSLSGTIVLFASVVGFAPDAVEFIRFADFISDNSIYMAQTLVQIFVHVVFSTKNRADMITPEIEPELFAYIGGVVSNNNSTLVAANGTANHIHLLILLSKTIGLSELVGDLKRNSSRWIKNERRKL